MSRGSMGRPQGCYPAGPANCRHVPHRAAPSASPLGCKQQCRSSRRREPPSPDVGNIKLASYEMPSLEHLVSVAEASFRPLYDDVSYSQFRPIAGNKHIPVDLVGFRWRRWRRLWWPRSIATYLHAACWRSRANRGFLEEAAGSPSYTVVKAAMKAVAIALTAPLWASRNCPKASAGAMQSVDRCSLLEAWPQSLAP